MAGIAALLLSGCTTVGMHTRERAAVDYGAPVTMRVCILKAPRVSDDRVDELIGAVNREFVPYGIRVTVPWVRPWVRPAQSFKHMFDDVMRRDLEPPCDRLVVFADRNAGDALRGMLMPEILGAVDDTTHTRGLVIANRATLNQLLQSPEGTAVHEFYHLLGCPHAMSLSKCYIRIALVKRQFARDPQFFPGVRADGRLLVTRDAANSMLRRALDR
ncbi:hypothetical protein [Aerolutibacter daejeonensis]|nr:hypothetical protein [Lysobacter daejeonensis]